MKLTVAFLSVIAIAAAQDIAIDIQRSTITIHVGKAGLLSVAGHDHTIGVAKGHDGGAVRHVGRVERSREGRRLQADAAPQAGEGGTGIVARLEQGEHGPSG